MHPKGKYGSGSKTGDFDTATKGEVKSLEKCGDYGSNANVHESKLDAGGHDNWRGKRGKKGGSKKAMSY